MWIEITEIKDQLWEQKMVAKDTSYGSETYRPYLDIERINNVQSTGSVNRGHNPILFHQ